MYKQCQQQNIRGPLTENLLEAYNLHLLSNLSVQPTINKGLLTSLYLHLVNKPN